MNRKDKWFNNVSKHFPEAALEYCCELWLYHGFTFKISRQRKTKLGDFTYNRKTGDVRITVNNNLNPYAFLITYLHEVAHLVTYKQYQDKVKPHGEEWQASFQKIARPVLNSTVFPPDILKAFQSYLERPKASSCADLELTLILQRYDGEENKGILLATVSEGEKFSFKDRVFIKISKKRSRVVCKDLANGKRYLISEIAQVEKIA